MKTIFLMMFFILLSSPVWAMKLEVPDEQARHLQMFFPQSSPEFFTCETPVQFLQTTSHCDFICEDEHTCRSNCANAPAQKFLMQAEECTPETVEIVDTIGWNFKAKSHPNDQFGQTWIEDFLNATDFLISPSGSYHLDFVMPPQERTVVDENGEETSVQSVTLYLSLRQAPELSSTQLELILDLNKRGIDQLLYFGFPDHREYFLKKWGLL